MFVGMSAADGPRYGIQELADLGGVSRRTVRYYVQEGLLPAADGTGRGGHYKALHLARLVRIRELQEEGVPLAEIPARLEGRASGIAQAPVVPVAHWARLRIADDVEIHVRTDRRGPWLLREDDAARIEKAVRTALLRREER